MTEEKKSIDFIMNNRPIQSSSNKLISDDVIIEIVHAVKDIIIEFINRKYPTSADK